MIPGSLPKVLNDGSRCRFSRNLIWPLQQEDYIHKNQHYIYAKEWLTAYLLLLLDSVGQPRTTAIRLQSFPQDLMISLSQVPRGSSGGGDAIRHGLLASAVGDQTK